MQTSNGQSMWMSRTFESRISRTSARWCSLGGHKGTNDTAALSGEQLGEVRGAAKVLRAVCITESEVSTEARAEFTSVQ